MKKRKNEGHVVNLRFLLEMLSGYTFKCDLVNLQHDKNLYLWINFKSEPPLKLNMSLLTSRISWKISENYHIEFKTFLILVIL